MPCATVWVTSFDPKVPSGFEYTCWTGGDLTGVNQPPDTGGGSAGSESGITGSTGPIPGPVFDPGDGSGTVVVGGNTPPPAPTGPTVSLNPGWNGGAHSVPTVPANWTGMISFDLPDTDGARQGGIAVGLAPVSKLPTVGRSGYAHLHYGLVCTADYVRVIHNKDVVLELDYADVRAAREGGSNTDLVSVLMYGAFIKWIVNGLTLFAGAFTMPEPYALDATLYLALDSVDNPKFEEGEWGDVEDGSLNGALPAFEMTADASPETGLSGSLQAFAAQFSDSVVWNLFGALPAFQGQAGEGEGISSGFGPLSMIAADIANYAPLVGSFKPLRLAIGMGDPDETVTYSVLAPSFPKFGMSMTFPPTARLEASMRAFEMRASSQASYSELRAPLRGLRFLGYGGEMTPLVQLVENIGTRLPVYQSTYVALVFVERINGTTDALAYVTITADAMNAIKLGDATTMTATVLQYVAELIGVGERLVVLAHRDDGTALAGEGEAWVVNTRSGASTRYEQYGFNSFATVRGKQYGMATDGLYLLEGKDDAGTPIKSGVHLGQHDFGTQQEKGIRAIYAGVGSTGCLFMKIDDGRKAYTYRAIRNEERMRIQRFDPGQGLSANYFSFELVSEADAFELDNVKFDIIASQRRI